MDAHAPLVPADCDLLNFLRMPVAVGRLLASDTWIAAADDPRLGHALMSLWGESWRQVPAGSLPDIDTTLQRLSMCPTAKEWARVRDRALNGWLRCSDGRLYHPVVCEMALECWLEKLTTRGRGAEGNAKRWGGEFDRTLLDAQIDHTCALLRALNPNSQALAKRRQKPAKALAGILAGSQGNGGSGGSAIPQGSPRDRTGIAERSLKDRNRSEVKGYPPNPHMPPPVDNFETGSVPRLPAGQWWRTRQGVEQAGQACGCGAWDEAAAQLGQGEHWLAYRERVLIAAGDGPWLGEVQRAPVSVAAALQAGGVH
jgi:hypothetical protein